MENLIVALMVIKMLENGLEITAIQYEDGSKRKFNYQVSGTNRWKFIDLTDQAEFILMTKAPK